MPCAFQVHHRIRNSSRSEREAALNTQEDCNNETHPKIHRSSAHGRDKISIYDAILEQKVEVILSS